MTASEDVLLQAILGLLDSTSDNRLARLRSRSIPTFSTQFPAGDVYALLDAVETVRPGLLDHYMDIRRQAT